MNNKHTIKVTKLKQSKWNIFVGKINAYKLYEMAKADIMSINNSTQGYDGIQRELKPERVLDIKNYLQSSDATFPNSIILNLDKKYLIDENEDEIIVTINKNTFSILDGQHRLSGFSDDVETNFELNISIFIGLEIFDQQRIFNTINTEQEKVNNSQSFYIEMNDNINTPRKFAAEIANIFATDVTSPWYQKIKLLGKKDELSPDGRISLDTFTRPIVDSIYKDKYFYQLREYLMKNDNKIESLVNLEMEKGRSFLWEYYINQDKETMYKIYYNYFNAIKNTLPNDWSNPNSILTKTTGYNAFMSLFKDLILIGLDNLDVSEEFFIKKLNILNDMDGKFNSNEFAASGAQSSAKLYQILKNKVINLFN